MTLVLIPLSSLWLIHHQGPTGMTVATAARSLAGRSSDAVMFEVYPAQSDAA